MSDGHHPRGNPNGRRRARWLAAVVLIGSIALLPWPAGGAAGASAASSAAARCPNVTFKGHDGRKRRFSMRLIGSLTCAKGRQVMRAYLRRDCTAYGSHCLISLRGGWGCSVSPPGEYKLTGGLRAGCGRGNPTRAAVELFPPKGPGRANAESFQSPDLKVLCIYAFARTDRMFCLTRSGGSVHGLLLTGFGNVIPCPSAEQVCPDMNPAGAVALADGQRDQPADSGIRCTATGGGIRCIALFGDGKGKGFFVSPTTATPIG
jgi:hypothetical protein